MIMEDGINSVYPVESMWEERPLGDFSDRNLAALPQEEVRAIISRLQALAPGQGTAQGISQTPTTHPTEDKPVLW